MNIIARLKEKWDKWNKEAPERRERAIDRLEQEAEIERLKSKARKFREQNKPKEGSSFNDKFNEVLK